MKSSSLALALVLALALALPSVAQAQQHRIKLATLAPEGSGWIKVLRAVDQEVRERTEGAVGFKFYPGGVQGNETVMLRKIRVGQLHAGGFGGLGASLVLPDILALEMPFLFDNYEEIEYVLGEMDAYYQVAYQEKGFVLLGWADIGFVHILSKTPVAKTDDIEALKVWRLEGEPITEVLFRNAGVSSVPLVIPDVLLGLQTDLIEVVYVPPAAAIVLQWFARVSYITELPINYTLGPLLVDKRVFDRISPEHQTILLEVCRRHMQQQRLQSREDNRKALEVMQDQGLELVTPLPEDVEGFRQLVADSVPELVGQAVPREAYDLVRHYLAQFRQSRAAPDVP